MNKHPQLEQLINDINSRKRRSISFTYGDGHKAHLSVTPEVITITCDNPRLTSTLGKVIEKILGGNPKDAIDNFKK